MKKLIVKSIWIIAFILLYYITNKNDIFLFTVTFSLYLVLINIFSSDSFSKLMKDYHDKNYIYSENKIFKYGIIWALFLGAIIAIVCYFSSSIIVIKHLNIVSIFMSLSLIFTWIMNLENEYLKINNKKMSDYLLNIFQIISFICFMIILILSYKVLKVPDYLKVSFLYLSSVISFLFINIILYFNYFRKKKKLPKRREELKINYFKEIKNKISFTSKTIIYKALSMSYIYISIIILFFSLTNRYNYKYATSSEIINNTYFYGLIFIYLIYLVIIRYYQNDVKALKESIQRKDDGVDSKTNILLNRVFNVTMQVVIVMSVISGPICKVIFNTDTNIILGLLPLLFVIVIYKFILELNILVSKSKNIYITIITGLIVKIIFEIPLIDTIYRMGYSLSFGSILANVIGISTSIIIGMFYLYRKLKISFIDNFSKTLNIIYENILLCSILLLFTLIVKVDTTSFSLSFFVILFYLFITLIFLIIKKYLGKR